jgi:hypothetical protein
MGVFTYGGVADSVQPVLDMPFQPCPALIYTSAEINAFILGAKDGDLDHLIC